MVETQSAQWSYDESSSLMALAEVSASAPNHDLLNSNADSSSQQDWPASDDLLEILMSDTMTWPFSLPVMQFADSSPEVNQGLGYSSDGARQGEPSGTSGHSAVQHLSQLIKDLSTNLTAEIESTGITNVYLDTCLHMFFTHFIPTFPVMHRPTFVSRDCSHPLLLNIIALGSLFVSAKDAVAKGEALWKLAHTAVATSWQSLMTHRGPNDACAGVQLVLTAVFGQVYASLSKNKSLRRTSHIFHGLGFYWARQCGMYETYSMDAQDLPDRNSPIAEKTTKWKFWTAREVQFRAILAHYILDGQIAQLSGHPTCVRHLSNPLLLPSSEAAFNAASVDDWIVEMHKQPPPHTSFREFFSDLFNTKNSLQNFRPSNFSLKVILEGLQSIVAESNEACGVAIGIPYEAETVQALLRLYHKQIAKAPASSIETMEIMLRWHSICLNVATDAAMLCRQICHRHGIEQQVYGGMAKPSYELDLQTWANSVDGRRAILHATAIQDMAEKLPIGRAHAIHVPAAIFAAATVYVAQWLANISPLVIPNELNWQDVWKARTTDYAGEGSSNSEVECFVQGVYHSAGAKGSPRNLLYDLNNLQIMLKSLSSRWGLSREMERVLENWMAIPPAAV